MADLEKIRLSELDESHPEIMEAVALDIRSFARSHRGFPSLDQHIRDAAAHSVFLTLHNMTPEQREDIKKPAAYIARAVKRALSKQWRRQREAAAHLDPGGIPDVADPGEGVNAFGHRVLLSEIWNRLEDEDRKLLYSIIFGYTSEEMAKILDISSAAAVRQRIQRLRSRLKQEFFSDNENPRE